MSAKRVLIVESPRAQVTDLADELARAGHDTRWVARGADAVREACGTSPPDVVLMDLRLPDMDGVQALRLMKACRQPAFLPVLIRAEGADLDCRVRALLHGADDFIARPCPSAEVAARVAVMLRIQAAQDGLQSANQELERRSITDPLTGLFNRRYFEHRLEQEVERTRRYRAPVSLMLLDLDHFKDVNDRYGHHTGDVVLHTVAGLLRDELRRMDACTRWGGEEFAAIMPNADESGALVVCQRVMAALRTRARVAASPLSAPGAGPELLQVAASIGVATFPAAGLATAEQLFQAADGALYAAKSGGRNRICRAHAAGPPAAAEAVQAA